MALARVLEQESSLIKKIKSGCREEDRGQRRTWGRLDQYRWGGGQGWTQTWGGPLLLADVSAPGYKRVEWR